MKRPSLPTTVLACALAAGCQAVNTTSGGAVGVDRKQYMFSMLSTEQVNQMYAQSYHEAISQAASAGVLVKGTADARRVQTISQRLIAQAPVFRPDAAQWPWEVSLIDSQEMNANCGPGGKIMVYTGLIEQLKLTDDELAAVIGHEIAHALREHSREALSKAYGVELATQLGAALGVGQGGLQMANLGVEYLMTLPNSRGNENEADLIGLELSARAGYDPNAALTLWEKMARAANGAPPEFMSTHPSSSTRMSNLRETIPKVMPLYRQATSR
ncbi:MULTISPECIES: M48 family metallopeptidase [Pseudomonas]|uniref:Peptidase M48 n=1 Tax=Pseudomonas flexibilis TaxID=706570 RepID=A0A0B3BTW8_9PSED|nr:MULTISPECIES: M48 family metallopeptidase [Pseudomonas]KHO66075.1 peptidase M48 [Pseudomonas flexibilis]SCY51985.1 Peptidase family M48 [Pseudomonas flexibilis]